MNQPIKKTDEDSLFLPEYYRDLSILHLIGRGRAGKVYLVENPAGKKAALKVTMCTTPRLTNSAIREYAFLQRMSGSSRVLEGYDFRLEVSPRGVMTAWLLEESAQVLSADDPTLTARDRLAVGVSVCEAMIDCRRKGIAHLDIKQSNVFHGLDGVWKVGDFSHSARLNHLGRLHSAVGSPGYMAPEVYARHRFSQQSEIYSTGVLLYRLFAGSMPFPCDASHPCRSEDDRAERAGLSDPLWQILEKATAFRPEDRYPSFEALRGDLRSLHTRDLPTVSELHSFTRKISGDPRSAGDSCTLPRTMGHTFSFENRSDSPYWYAEETWSTEGAAFD
ncbi:MAG: protein kinase [Clostridia bacterium]|nr:protein kinase [Clostridia bacterium]